MGTTVPSVEVSMGCGNISRIKLGICKEKCICSIRASRNHQIMTSGELPCSLAMVSVQCEETVPEAAVQCCHCERRDVQSKGGRWSTQHPTERTLPKTLHAAPHCPSEDLHDVVPWTDDVGAAGSNNAAQHPSSSGVLLLTRRHRYSVKSNRTTAACSSSPIHSDRYGPTRPECSRRQATATRSVGVRFDPRCRTSVSIFLHNHVVHSEYFPHKHFRILAQLSFLTGWSTHCH